MATDPRQARYIHFAQQAAEDTIRAWQRDGFELGTKAHAKFQIASKRLAWLLAPALFVDEIWYCQLGHGNKIHACRGSHAICHSASGRGIRSGLVAAHSIDFTLTADDVTCEKCRAALPGMLAWLEEKKQPAPVAKVPDGTKQPIDPTMNPVFWADNLRGGNVRDALVRSIVWDVESCRNSGRINGMVEMAMRKLDNAAYWAMVTDILTQDIPHNKLSWWLTVKFDTGE